MSPVCLVSIKEESLDQVLTEALRVQYGLSGPLRFERPRRGYSSETWIVTIPGPKRVVLQRYPESFTDAKVRFTHSLRQYLKENRFPVAGVIQTLKGDSCIQIASRYYALSEYLQGVMMTRPLSRWLRASTNAVAGRTLGWFHQLMKDFQPAGEEPAPNLGYSWFRNEFSRYRQEISRRSSTEFDRLVLQSLEGIEIHLEKLGVMLDPKKRDLQKAVIHGDFGPPNVLFLNGKVVGVLDLNSARRGARVEDVAYALATFSQWAIRWSNPILHSGMGSRLLHAYQEIYPLTSQELELLPYLMIYGRLKTSHWILMQYYDRNLEKSARWFLDNLKLLQWMQTHEAQLKALCRGV